MHQYVPSLGTVNATQPNDGKTVPAGAVNVTVPKPSASAPTELVVKSTV